MFSHQLVVIKKQNLKKYQQLSRTSESYFYMHLLCRAEFYIQNPFIFMGLCVRVHDGCARSTSALQFIRLFNQEGKTEIVVVATESSKTNTRESRIISVVALRLLNPAQVLHSFCALSPTA